MMNFKKKVFIVFSFSLLFLNNNFLNSVTIPNLKEVYLEKGFSSHQVETILGNIGKAVGNFTSKNSKLSFLDIEKIARWGLPGFSNKEIKTFLFRSMGFRSKKLFKKKMISATQAVLIICITILDLLPRVEVSDEKIPEYSGSKTKQEESKRGSKAQTLFAEDNEYEEVIIGSKRIVKTVEPLCFVVTPVEFLYFPANLDDGYDPDEDKESLDSADEQDIVYMLRHWRL